MSSTPGQTQTDSPIFLGIDAGTSGIRACCIDQQASPIAEVSRPLPAPEIQGNQVAQAPQLWASVLDDVLKALSKKTSFENLKTIAIDGTSGTVFFTDDQGHPTSKALMYNDARALEQVQQLQTLTDNTVVQSVAAGLPKLMWLNEHDSADASHALHQADWLGFLLTDQIGHSDVNNCLKTGYDPVARKWPEWLRQLPAIQKTLPRVHSPGSLLGPVSRRAIRDYGFPATTQLVAGTTDSHAAILATGISNIGEAVTSLGSTLVVKVISELPIFDKDYGIYSQPYGALAEQRWLVGGGSNSGGAVLRQYFTDDVMQTLSEKINPEQDTGLDYYPLSKPGERFPINDPQLSPRLTPRPDDDVQFFQGLLEGIARIEHQAYQRLAELGAPYPISIRTVGGGAKNDAWTRIRARYCQTAIMQSEYTEAAYGSALLAMQGYVTN